MKLKFYIIYNVNYVFENVKFGIEIRGNNWWKEEFELMKLVLIIGG